MLQILRKPQILAALSIKLKLHALIVVPQEPALVRPPVPRSLLSVEVIVGTLQRGLVPS